MSRPRFSIGIDLGTTNTALAYEPLDGSGRSHVLAIPQLESPIAIVEATTLPSFLYLPEDVVTPANDDTNAIGERWVIGRLARTKAAETPGRVVHSAKSWLGHHSADRSAPFLPWGSDDVGDALKISPVQASALILRYLREAWNDRFAAEGEDLAFDAQVLTITVPASFDAAAQRLTLAAAHEAGYPQTVRLLEEPQAALYSWLGLHGAANGDAAALGDSAEPRHVVVIDIGGGTSDFSLFELYPHDESVALHIKRIAVSEHLLLGGDNMDLALAHRLEPQLVDHGESLSGRQWNYLVARCRDVKEKALGIEASAQEPFSISIPSRGSQLIAGVRSASLTGTEIDRLLLDGFFPECAANEYPLRSSAALREQGLPYARDPAITRHLADFLRGRPAVDAVLFNGGALYPRRVRQRICSEITKWQSAAAPIVLENLEPDLAVARGAARFGQLVYRRAERIEAGTAHAIFLQAQRANDAGSNRQATHSLICVLPQGAPAEETFAIQDLGLALRTNALVRFAAFSSARHGTDRAGDIVAWNDQDFHALPPLETQLDVADARGASPTLADRSGVSHDTVPVRLTAKSTELGHLEISCVSTDPARSGSWPLEFNLRRQAATARAEVGSAASIDTSGAIGPNVATDELDAARLRITRLFERPINVRDRLTATRLIKSLEVLLGVPKHAWNLVLVRSLWATLETCMAHRALSVDHEEAWLIMAGFLLRPGFGAVMDEARIDRLWTLRETGLHFAAKTVKIQEYVLWRRVAGGLSRERQERVLAPELAAIREQRNPPPELVLLAGSLERVGLEIKTELVDRFIDAASALEREHKHNAHFVAALGSLLNRAPLYGGPETVVSADVVQRIFDAFSRLDWDGPKRIEFQTLFLRAARVVNNRSIDVSRSLRNRIAEKLEKSGVPPSKTAPLRDYMPLQRAERAGSFGESLPPGLILREPASS